MSTCAHILKIGLAVTELGRLLVVRKRGTSAYILPGGKPEAFEGDLDTLTREVDEELGCEINPDALVMLGVFTDKAANETGKTVTVKLYQGQLIGHPRPQAEIEQVRWLHLDELYAISLAPSLENSIIPFLASKGHVTRKFRHTICA